MFGDHDIDHIFTYYTCLVEFDGKFMEANIPNIEALGHTIQEPKH